MVKTKITPFRPTQWKCGFCPTSFLTKEARDKHLTECANSRYYCNYCFYNTDKITNLHRHTKSQHYGNGCQKENTKTNESEDEKSDNDWESQDPGDVIGDISESESESNLEDNKKPETVSKDEAENKNNISDQESDKSKGNVNSVGEDAEIGRIVRRKTKPRLPGTRKAPSSCDSDNLIPCASAMASDIIEVENDKSDEEKSSRIKQSNDRRNTAETSSEGSNDRESSVVVNNHTDRRRFVVEMGTQTDPLLYTTTITTETTYREGNRKVRIVEVKKYL